MKPAHARARLATAIPAVIVLIVHLALGLWGVDAPAAWGHLGHHVGEHGLASRALLRHGQWQPLRVVDAATLALGPDFHHPSMLHPYVALVQAFAGEAPWTVRIVPVVFGAIAIGALLWLARRRMGRIGMSVTGAAAVLTPIHGAFVNLPDQQIVAMAYLLCAACALEVAMRRSGTRRRGPVVVWFACVVLALFSDWNAYFALSCFAALTTVARRHGTDPIARRVELRYAWGAIVVAFAIALQHLARAHAAGMWNELVGAGAARMEGGDYRWREGVLGLHLPLAPEIMVAWTVALALRRRRLDRVRIWMLSFLLAVVCGALLFTREFMTHEYRSYWAWPAIAWMAGDLAAWGAFAIRRGSMSRARRSLAVAGAVLVGIGLVMGLWKMPAMAAISRAQAGSVYWQGYDARHGLMMAAAVARSWSDPSDRVFLSSEIEPRPEVLWWLDRPAAVLASPDDAAFTRAIASGRRPVIVCGANALGRRVAWQDLLRHSEILLIDEYAVVRVDPDDAPMIEATAVVQTPPWGPLMRYLHAPARGPSRVALRPVDVAREYALLIGHGSGFVRDLEARRGTILRALPDDLVDRETELLR